jgi:tRNA A-37 threonylcarbamoyl transferase component Bud32
MSLAVVLKDPEKYRIASNYPATNKVFPIHFRGSTYMVKQTRWRSSLSVPLYVLQDRLFYGSRKLGSVNTALSREVDILQRLQGAHAPRLAASNQETLVKEFIPGHDIRPLYDADSSLEKALDAMYHIHEKSILIGDAHAKNVVLTKDRAYWVDFDGVFDETNLIKGKAVDILKFVYSTYTLTRDAETTFAAASLALQHPDKDVQATVRELVNPGLSWARAWFPTRVSLKINQEIKKILG